MESTWARRSCAAAAALVTTVGGIAIVVGVGALPHPWTTGYISEAGVATEPRSTVYRLGILALCAGLVLLGVALGAVQAVLAAGLLIAAGVVGSVSAAVTCSPGCPLPPYEHPHARDLIHAGFSIVSIGLTALAILALASPKTPSIMVLVIRSPVCRATNAMIDGVGPLRTLARATSALAVPLIATLGICLLAIGRGTTTAVLERLVLAVLAAWVIITATMITMASGITTMPRQSNVDEHGTTRWARDRHG